MSQIKELLKNQAVSAAEQILLPVEEILWQNIRRKPEVEQILEQPGARVLLIGTNRQASLAQEIKASYPQASITVLDRNPTTIAAARRNAQETDVCFMNQDIFDIKPSDMLPLDLTVAKHLIHLIPADELVAHVQRLLKPDGVFYASVPLLCARKPSRQLRAAEIPFDQEPLLGKGLKGGTLLIFRTEAR